LGDTALGNTALPVAAGAGDGAGLAAVAFGGVAVEAGGGAAVGVVEGVGASVASAPHCALRKSFHFMSPRVPAPLAALYLALHSFIESAFAELPQTAVARRSEAANTGI